MVAKILFTAAATFTRLSLLCFYLRIVKDIQKKYFRWAVYANIGFSVAIFIAFIYLSIFQCNPVRNYWVCISCKSKAGRQLQKDICGSPANAHL
ncbi:hypothetical protein CC80DRAFT_21465 [Byssothecium circinans]|uniref:Rhodopsin domain-containing protein n=1 Tax=Byssothecium circinans TaxID=147558 RepID=A0A6A5U7K1_9PLEO|nr:hypothetical protein CC80DRAFT_21465 [Byssothecium circinans]